MNANTHGDDCHCHYPRDRFPHLRRIGLGILIGHHLVFANYVVPLVVFLLIAWAIDDVWQFGKLVKRELEIQRAKL